MSIIIAIELFYYYTYFDLEDKGIGIEILKSIEY